MSRIAERDLLGIRVPCASYHIMRRKGATLLINMHVFRFSEFTNLAFAPPSLLPCSITVESVLFSLPDFAAISDELLRLRPTIKSQAIIRVKHIWH